MSDPVERARASFRERFGAEPALAVVAPGRVNLIGEHTDYNDGFVLPCAIDFGTAVVASPRADGVIRAVAADFGGAEDAFSVAGPIAHADGWAEYLRGAVQTLAGRGWTLGGADLAIAGDVPQGAGLSSSASLLVALIETLRTLAGLETVTPTDVAVLARAAENEFVGVACGIMDQLISARGVLGHALLIDCRSLDGRPVRIADGLAVLIVHSGIERGLVGSEYNRRREECERAARHYGVAALRDVDLTMLQARREGLDEVAFRRARHIVTENARVLETAAALEARDTAALARLMATSHASMRDDFEITVPGIDRLVEIMGEAIGTRGGARMTGGGFGGCAVAVLEREVVAGVLDAIASGYRTPLGEVAATYLCTASAGVGVVG